MTSVSVLKAMRHGNGLHLDATGYCTYPAFLASHRGALLWRYLVLKTALLPGEHRTALFRPFACVTCRADSGMVVSYENLRDGKDLFPDIPWDKPIAMFPHKAVAAMTYAEFGLAEETLFAFYSGAGLRFAENATLPDEFIGLFVRLLHPIALPFLKQISPVFFRSLHVERNTADTATI